MDVNKKILELDIELPNMPCKAGLYSQCVKFSDKLVYLSGCGPDLNGVEVYKGKLGNEVSIEQGQLATRNCLLNALAILKSNIGDLNRVKRFVKIISFVASSDDFYQQPLVANGASQCLIDIFGEEIGTCARSAIGVNVLPGNIPVEIEFLIELY